MKKIVLFLFVASLAYVIAGDAPAVASSSAAPSLPTVPTSPAIPPAPIPAAPNTGSTGTGTSTNPLKMFGNLLKEGEKIMKTPQTIMSGMVGGDITKMING